MARFSLRAKVILGFSLACLAGMSALGIITYFLTSKIVYELTEQDLKDRIHSVQTVVDVAYDDDIDRLKTIGKKLTLRYLKRFSVSNRSDHEVVIENQLTKQKINTILPELLLDGKSVATNALVDEITDQTGSFATLFILTPQGLVRVSTSVLKEDGSRAIGTFVPPESEVYQTITSGKPYFGRAFVVNNWLITSYEPIILNGKVIGAFFVGSPENSYETIKERLKAEKILDTGYFFALNSKGEMVLHPKLEGQPMLNVTDVDGRKIFKEIIDAKNGVLDYRWKITDKNEIQNKLAIFEYIPKLDWYIAASLNKAEAYAGVYKLRTISFLTTLAVTILTALLVTFYANRIIRMLMSVAEKLGRRSSEITEGSKRAKDSSDSLASASGEQSAAVQQTAAALEEINATVQKNLAAALQSENLSDSNRQQVERGFDTMKRLQTAVSEVQMEAGNMQQAMSESFEQMRAISTLMSGIEEQAKHINDIVFQTKLLSFNASVEAARAGEHGKGFSVVAEEVGRLAAQTGKTASDIQEAVSSATAQVAQRIEMAESKIKTSVDASKRKVQEIASTTGIGTEALSEILNTANRIHQAVSSIAAASREQSAAVSEISAAISQIETTSQENNILAEQASLLSTDLAQQAAALSSLNTSLEAVVFGGSKGI